MTIEQARDIVDYFDGTIEAYCFTESCHEGMPEPDPEQSLQVWMDRQDWSELRDALAVLLAHSQTITSKDPSP